MYCSKCGKEIPEDSKFCEHCGNKVKDNRHLVIDKRIIIMIGLVLISIITVCIGMYIYKHNNNFTTSSINTANQDSKEDVIFEDLEVQENNGYKTFNFTIDDVISSYLMNIDKVLIDKCGAYCQANPGTSRAIFSPNKQILSEYEKYVSDITIIYEDKSRKVISVNTPLMTMQLVEFLSDNNMEWTDDWVEEAKNNVYQYMLSLLVRVKKQLKNVEVLGDASNSKYIYTSTNNICGRYKMIEENIGLVQCLIEKPINLYLIIRATDEDKFYNSNINELLDISVTNMYNDVKQENKTTEISENYNNSNFNITGTYTDRIAAINSEGYGTSYDVYIFNSGAVEHTEDMTTYKGTYTIKDNKITIIYTGAYDIETPIKLDKFNDELIIKDENTLVTLDGIEYLKEQVNQTENNDTIAGQNKQQKVNKELKEGQEYVGIYKNDFGALLEIAFTEDGNVEFNRRTSYNTYAETYNNNVNLNKKRQSSQAIILYEEDWGDVQNNYYLYPIGYACEINDFGEIVQTDTSKTRIIFESIYDGVNHGSAYYKID